MPTPTGAAPPPPALSAELLPIDEALDRVRRSPHAQLRDMRVLVEERSSGPGVPEGTCALSPLLLVELRGLWRGLADESPGDVKELLVVDRRDGVVYRKQPEAFPALARAAGIFAQPPLHAPQTWAMLYLALAEGALPWRFVDADPDDQAIGPATLTQTGPERATLLAWVEPERSAPAVRLHLELDGAGCERR
jgi:hypothetical protein